jgi:hypothetical protein
MQTTPQASPLHRMMDYFWFYPRNPCNPRLLICARKQNVHHLSRGFSEGDGIPFYQCFVGVSSVANDNPLFSLLFSVVAWFSQPV